MRRPLTLTAVSALALGGLLVTTTPALAAHEELTAAGLAAGGTKVTTFSLEDGRAEKALKITGLSGDKRLVGIDYRVFGGDSSLYGVGDRGGLYRVDPATGAATSVGRLSVPLEGSSFGVDFNPVANALRIISDTGQNLRQSFGNLGGTLAPTVVDGDLNYGGTQVGTTNRSEGGTPALGVTGAAYTENLPSTTTTALLDIDTTKDVLAQQNANPGILTARGPLGVDAGEVAGFDIYTSAPGSNLAIALLFVDGERGLYSIDQTTGAATFLTGVTRGVSELAIVP